MGSKSKLIDFVLEGINSCNPQNGVVDLFAGSCTLAGAIGNQTVIHSNDIQNYSKVLAETYTISYCNNIRIHADEIISKAKVHQIKLMREADIKVDYIRKYSVEDLANFEKLQQNLLQKTFEVDFHYFTKTYSGTWWSVEQCAAIDGLRKTAEEFKESPMFQPILAAAMYAMAYSSIGTGHYAQFRDPKTDSNVKDILIYRQKDTFKIFKRKFSELIQWLPKRKSKYEHINTALDFKECLNIAKEGSVIYADPPYAFVHYSRFYHALETFVLYDSPSLQIKNNGELVKGRYRSERHQSPFCIKTKVESAFTDFFDIAKSKDMKIALSYSNKGMISLDEILQLANEKFTNSKIDVHSTDYNHMTLGRQFDQTRKVKEALILIN